MGVSLLAGSPIVVLDLETLHSADECRHCGLLMLPGHREEGCLNASGHERLGWNDPSALGLSIGCYFSYADGALHWFDIATVADTLLAFTATPTHLVSFNGVAFDFPLMRGMVRREAQVLDACGTPVAAQRLLTCCDVFTAQYAGSYDVLAEIWRLDPPGKRVHGLNSLDALCAANGLPRKAMDGAAAPRLWAQGRYADVIEYNVGDVLRTKALFEMVCRGEPIRRGDGTALVLPKPSFLNLSS